MTRALALLAVVLLGGFFLPWFGAEVGQGLAALCGGATTTASGFSIVRCLIEGTLQASEAGMPDAFSTSVREAWPLWLLAAIPVFGVLTLLAGLAGSGLAHAFAFLAGAVPVGQTIYAVVEEGTEMFQYFEVGAWATLGAGVLLVLLAFAPRGR